MQSRSPRTAPHTPRVFVVRVLHIIYIYAYVKNSKQNQSVFVPSPAPQASNRKPCCLSLEAPVYAMWGFPKLGVPFLGVPIIRIEIYWGSMLGPPYFGKLPHAKDTLQPFPKKHGALAPSPMTARTFSAWWIFLDSRVQQKQVFRVFRVHSTNNLMTSWFAGVFLVTLGTPVL